MGVPDDLKDLPDTTGQGDLQYIEVDLYNMDYLLNKNYSIKSK
jgi:hypothetical protein